MIVREHESSPQDVARRAMLKKHGFDPDRTRHGSKSKRMLLDGKTNDPNTMLPAQDPNRQPKNAAVLDAIKAKYGPVTGFDWKLCTRTDMVFDKAAGAERSVQRQWVHYENYPTIAGQMPTLTELFVMPVELVDGYDTRQMTRDVSVGRPVIGHRQRLALMNNTGIGYKGLCGTSWMPSIEPIALPSSLEATMKAIGKAVFLLYDAVAALYGYDPELTRLLAHKTPERIMPWMRKGGMDILRPDMVLLADPCAPEGMRPVITELESCPAGQGMAHAMELGYGMPPQIVPSYLQYLDGHRYVIAATAEWVDYTFEQAAFCKALIERGVEAHLVFDRPLDAVAKAAAGWKPPKEMPVHLRALWDTDLLRRLRENKMDSFVHGSDDFADVPIDLINNAVLFRFGYFDNFSRGALQHMACWEDEYRASFMNPLQFALESKALMAAIHLKSVRDWLSQRDHDAVDILDRHVAETHLLAQGFADLDRLRADQNFWLTKFAAWDGGNQSWGSRSLSVGSQVSLTAWGDSLAERLVLPHPVVAQHVIASTTFDIAYTDVHGNAQVLRDARTRLTPFLMRDRREQGAIHAGSTITLRSKTFRIHGATDAVEGPVVYR